VPLFRLVAGLPAGRVAVPVDAVQNDQEKQQAMHAPYGAQMRL
jgi:hypothetical protein